MWLLTLPYLFYGAITACVYREDLSEKILARSVGFVYFVQVKSISHRTITVS